MSDSIEGQNNGEEHQEMSPVFKFLNYVSKLKHLDRTGWLRHGIKKPETVAGHMYRMAIMSGFVIDDPNIDINRCIKLSIVHDIGESIIGDITPFDGVTNETKCKLETEAIEKLASLLPGFNKGEEMKALFEEYENATTPEGRLVKDLDKFDMVLQAYEYEITEQQPKFLQEFFDSTKEYFKKESCHPQVKLLMEQLMIARESGVKFSL